MIAYIVTGILAFVGCYLMMRVDTKQPWRVRSPKEKGELVIGAAVLGAGMALCVAVLVAAGDGHGRWIVRAGLEALK